MSELFITGWPEKATLPGEICEVAKKRHKGTTCQGVRRQLSCRPGLRTRKKAILPDRDKDCALHHRLAIMKLAVAVLAFAHAVHGCARAHHASLL